VQVQFNASYVESLRRFGVRALDQRIRERVLEVLQRDYAGINVEFRTEAPTDYRLYSIVEISGPDPNGRGLLGYDNTPGKDVDNERLHDRIGGVNALTQLMDDAPGYGGVFIESIFTFSEHPPKGFSAEVPTPLFDDVFDPFRDDRGGSPVSSEDFAEGDIPMLSQAGGCPSTERRLQIACAEWVLGSIIGSTTSHEIGHSLGLADPYGPKTSYHTKGDGPNRLMDGGGSRPFTERAQLQGEGPGVFCQQEYDYLRKTLPSAEPVPPIQRPGC
jgi:hypothetical protein